MSNLKIRDVRIIVTQPTANLNVVKIETNEPEIYGLGCATFTQRALVVETAVNDYLRPFLIGKDPADIEDIWQSCNVSAYWRNGPILNNAISGVDQALWDIKGKVAGMPVYDLFGGKSREAAAVYIVPGGNDLKEYEENVWALIEDGFRYFKLGGADRFFADDVPHGEKPIITNKVSESSGSIYDPAKSVRTIVRAFEHFRSTFGWEVDVIYDVHERLPPIMGLGLAKELEPFRLFFLEDLFAPEDNDYFRLVREQTSTPIAMGELYNNPHEIIPMVKDRLLDFMRVHVSQIGGLTPARKLAALCEAFNVRTAWHGPTDVSPVGHAAQLMLDLNVWNFGIQEAGPYQTNLLKEVFPGTPEVRNGYMWANGKPGLGIDIDEELAAKYPITEPARSNWSWGNVRLADGTIIRP
ncbi:starvation-sensing protein RspA [Candidatus Poribacteria bacterium]|nr:starvation-sensing protein RspA [Candidatus Poribacteria bacterium]